MMKNFNLLLVATILVTSSAQADLSYVDVKARQTYVFFLEGNNVLTAPCANWSEVKSKQDCSLNLKAVLFDKDKATAFFLNSFSRIMTTAVALTPFTLSETSVLLNFSKPAGQFALNRHHDLAQQQLQMANVLKKYPDDPTTKNEMTKNQNEMAKIEASLSSGEAVNPEVVAGDFDTLVKSFLSLYLLDPKVTELLASKNEGTLVGALMQIMLTSPATGKMSFVKVLPGTFTMGDSPSDSYSRPHTVILTKEFEMQTTEVTQKQWYDVMGTNPSYYHLQNVCPTTYTSDFGGICPTNPVETVSWNDINEAGGFLARLNGKGDGYTYRLPTEAEWEYADRGGQNAPSTNTLYSFGDSKEDLKKYAWYDNKNNTQATGLFAANSLGLYDMEGNVAEWTSDFYGSYPTSPQTNPEGPKESSNTNYRMHRGGNFYSGDAYLRAGYREENKAEEREQGTGFRLVRTKKE